LLERFDREVRRGARSDRSVRVEVEPHIMRTVGRDDRGWFAVGWSDLDESTANAAIAHEGEFFGALGQKFEWKYYDYDRPPDLEQRLRKAGFKPEEDESVMVGEIAAIPRTPPPDGIRIVEASDSEGVDMLIAVHEAVFGRGHSRYRAQLLHQLETDPASHILALAMAAERAVSAARAEFPKTGSFASLWGGGTLPEWRGRGLYRALVSYRADRAAARGYRYLHVDASSESRPILERLGFVRLARTTPYIREPDAT
jgi:GNAT superfamily N-acetyltransferase